ncbi:hypothetical protein HanRHA438_Chr14g0680511 [Helianthus annuus]|nr:hypothetical protein HanRHA438_Chr14g0680511 [Helianthus annuus]
MVYYEMIICCMFGRKLINKTIQDCAEGCICYIKEVPKSLRFYVVKSAKSARLGARAQRGAPIAPGGSLGAKMGFFEKSGLRRKKAHKNGLRRSAAEKKKTKLNTNKNCLTRARAFRSCIRVRRCGHA